MFGYFMFFLIWLGFHVWVPSDFGKPSQSGWEKYWRLKREVRTNSQNILLRGAVNSMSLVDQCQKAAGISMCISFQGDHLVQLQFYCLWSFHEDYLWIRLC